VRGKRCQSIPKKLPDEYDLQEGERKPEDSVRKFEWRQLGERMMPENLVRGVSDEQPSHKIIWNHKSILRSGKCQKIL